MKRILLILLATLTISLCACTDNEVGVNDIAGQIAGEIEDNKDELLSKYEDLKQAAGMGG